jgi:lipoprotein-releasing system ATP-binding protein
LPELNALENVLVPTMIDRSLFSWFGARHSLRKRGQELLERFGMGHRLKHKPRELSGGEMQRTAIARALISQPRILLADEPTGNLDAETGGEIIRILRDLNRRDGLTIVMVTHNMELAAGCDRTVRLLAGRVENPKPQPAALAG